MHTRLFRAIIILAVGGALFGFLALGIHFSRDRSSQFTVSGNTSKTFADPGSVPIGGNFTMTDHTGRSVTDEDFGGKYLLVFFGFTHCPDICPTTLAEISRTLNLLGAEAATVQPIFVSLDPERDTPERLAEYVQAFHPNIVGLTGGQKPS